MKFNTRNVHFAAQIQAEEKSKSTPIYQTSAFAFQDLEEMETYFSGDKSYLYTRMGHPNTDELGRGVAQLENAEAGAASASGLSAILAGVLTAASHGDRVVATEDIYGGTYQLFENELQEFGIKVEFIDFSDHEAVKKALSEQTALLYTESLTNPLLRTEDLEAVAKLAREADAKLMVDNTFATPYLLQPHDHGADLVVHSATKYIGGHSDVTAGVLTGNAEDIRKARAKISTLGSNLGPFDAWIASRGLKTLSLRMDKQCSNAARLAETLRAHPAVKRTFYPEYVSPRGNGAIVTIDLYDHIDLNLFSKALSWVKVIPTLAGVETTISYPKGTSHRALSQEVRDRLGVTDTMIRVSVGIEDADDIADVFTKALEEANAAE
ncbi:trans-sulfuration enzyme family protein [Salisediminibacterium halotolerans]|uniref:trans-sulfuration enzyme family protein n=1 Tax=Salisediminibacterium halotolerans TaxID=517425 RepID=UPI000EB0233D|nr:aminotransferase class I/II-fold pyridoxal phosphate-dependent enzyme [Salisediminibacterium halotolerans]RLJ71631.1 cystathionine gamma-synthase [Actinophytocola xinjiangensis]RPE86781.1 cystathionine gamma-synthase [Salisediminibacterium halotolerans]TWG32844.1 cystathionine gamma-synthase [Salisediminibacterium halotolerans]GEL09180.1 cystathionine gamma-synthase [Salisediminibacterium halotolerans]